MESKLAQNLDRAQTINIFSTAGGISSGQKWIAAIILGLLFALISSNFVYRLTNTLFTSIGVSPLYVAGGPTLLGLLIHTIVFILIVRLIMW